MRHMVQDNHFQARNGYPSRWQQGFH
jgi:hypothetical protein